ncbi:hypothetical protein AAGW05_16955 [Arthrobacter sp. LAPM80]|uniref:hypothetical protein n=1 Tax=Arthrobacter sp. LAPM80 TaxID=3141788 RepID=UPI00398AA785
MTETIFLAILTSAALPSFAWMFRDAWSDRAKKIERLVELTEKAEGHGAIESIVAAEVKFEEKRRGFWMKIAMFVIFIAGGFTVGIGILLIAASFLPKDTTVDPWLLVGAMTAVGAAFGVRNYLRSGPKVS